MAILGLDVGDKRIGVAFADGLLAIPLTVVDRAGEEADMEKLLALAREHGAERIVVGLPLSMNGSIGRQAEKVLAFSGALARHVDIPVDTWDERLSTVAAERLLLDTGMKREKRKGKRDAMAAAIILQAYLDGING
ncbi:MAG: Holliday junction resolvase RuvX [Dehalococcoidia bacterium]|nr:MAG: Holliday junction resolvase RuvX [Dehalococcoidia bacterium]